MQTVAIICEYNPFHWGHKVQIDSVRAHFPDESVCIIALMSGEFVQRGGMAVLSTAQRAEIALELGVDLVLELPFPWSMSGADYFAKGAVTILESLGGIDYLCFGSECGEIDSLSVVAERLASSDYRSALDRVAAEMPTLSWASVREHAYFDAYGEVLPHYAPNDLLAIAYLSHLKSIKPLLLNRRPGYSASEARKTFAQGNREALAALVPPQTVDALHRRSERAEERTDVSLLSSLRLMTPDELSHYAEGTVELAGLIARHLPSAKHIEELVGLCTNKRYTSARVRRAIWHTFLRTPADLPEHKPAYTRLLGCNRAGREWLSAARKRASIPVITRVSNARSHPDAEAQFLFAERRREISDFLSGRTEKNLPILK